MQTIKTELVELLRRNDLLRASLIAGKVQNLRFEESVYAEQILELAAKAWERSGKAKEDPIFKIEAINYTLFQEFGLQGRTQKYKQVIDDPAKYYLHEVLKNKTGSPLSLCLLYLIVAEQIGLTGEVFAVGAYYLLKINDITTDFYVDPFDHGRLVTQDEFYRKFKGIMERNRMMSSNVYEKVTSQQLVARLVQQLKHIYILKGDALTALRAVELLTALYPQSPEITRDRGILYCEMEYFSKAMKDLKYYLKARPNAEDFAEIKKLTSMLKGYREVMN